MFAIILFVLLRSANLQTASLCGGKYYAIMVPSTSANHEYVYSIATGATFNLKTSSGYPQCVPSPARNYRGQID